MNGKTYNRIQLEDVFGFEERQEKALCGSGYKFTLTRKKDNTVLNKAPGIEEARNNNDNIHWYQPQFIPSIPKQGILSKKILSKTPMEFRYFERPVFSKEVKNQKLSSFELGNQERMNVPKWFIITFQQRVRQDSQDMDNVTLTNVIVHQLLVINVLLGRKKIPMLTYC